MEVVGGGEDGGRLCTYHRYTVTTRMIQDYYLIREIKTWLNINHIMVHNNALLYIF